MGEVLDLYRVAQNGSGAHLASLWPMDPPQVVWEGVQLYAQCVARIRDNHDDKAAEARGK